MDFLDPDRSLVRRRNEELLREVRLVRDRTRRTPVERVPPTELLAAMYDEAAEHWHDGLGLLGYPQAYEDLFDRLLADGTLRPLRDGGRVLDCGIGRGLSAWRLPGR